MPTFVVTQCYPIFPQELCWLHLHSVGHTHNCAVTISPNIVSQYVLFWYCCHQKHTYICSNMVVPMVCHNLNQNHCTVCFCLSSLLSPFLSISALCQSCLTKYICLILSLSSFFSICVPPDHPRFSRTLSSWVLAPSFVHCLLMHVRSN